MKRETDDILCCTNMFKLVPYLLTQMEFNACSRDPKLKHTSPPQRPNAKQR